MAWPSGFSDLTFEEAVAFFREQLGVTDEEYAQLSEAAKKKAFRVAGVAQLDAVNAVWQGIEKALEEGTTLEEFKAAVADKLQAAWGGTVKNPSARIECLPGDTLVSSAVVTAAHRRWFEGELVEVVTSSGRKFATTANHPMLTRHGWLASGELQEGHDLVGYRRDQHESSVGNQNVAGPPASIAEIFRACSEIGPLERVDGALHDFHGDGSDSQVDVARPHGQLSIGRFAPLTKPIEDYVFAIADASSPRFCRRCGHLNVVTKRCGFCDAPNGSLAETQTSNDRRVRRAKLGGERIRALAVEIACAQGFRRQVVPNHRWLTSALEVIESRPGQAAGHTGFANDAGDPSRGHAQRRSHIRDCSTSDITFDRVRSLRRREFRGHVFNLSTPFGYFAIDGLITGNTIFRTNVQVSYAAGRHAQATDPDVADERPFWRFEAVLDSRTSDVCRASDGTIKASDAAWWATHTPPLHHNCRSTFVTLTTEEAEALGLTKHPTRKKPADGFGGPPATNDWTPSKEDYPPELWARLEARDT